MCPNDTRTSATGELPTAKQRLQPTRDPALRQKLFELLDSAALDDQQLQQGLLALVDGFGDKTYSELLYLLSHLRFEPGEAQGHWQEILRHRRRMSEAMRSEVDLRVALMSYLVDSRSLLENPAVIELHLLEDARNFAFRDSLTGLYNFRFFREFLPREIWRADQYNNPLTLIVADIDDFKAYNDRYGHDEGNIALARIAVLLEESLRKVDVAVRYGGEEFVIVLPSTPKVGARLVAERAALAVASEEMHRGEKLSVSMGVATYPADASDGRELLRNADRAMYLAKAKGKNQIELFGNDRRSYSRVRASLDGKYREMSQQIHPLETVDLSGGGMRFRSEQSMPLGSLVDVDLELTETGDSVHLAGRVIDSREAAPGKYEVSVRIVEIGAQDRWKLALYLRDLSTSSEESDG